MRRRYNTNLISGNRCYTPNEICKALDLHTATIYRWMNNELPIFCPGTPNLIKGSDLILFLKKHNSKECVDLKLPEFYCMGCRKPHLPLDNKISIRRNGHSVRAIGICPVKRHKMCKAHKLDDLEKLSSFFTIVQEEKLNDSLTPLCNALFLEQTKTPETNH